MPACNFVTYGMRSSGVIVPGRKGVEVAGAQLGHNSGMAQPAGNN
jgi:hypothetical protein